MASGKCSTKRALEKVQSRQISHDPQESDKENLTAERDDDDRVIEIEPPSATESHPSQNKPSLPLHSEIIKGTGKKWTCKHCRKSFTSSYTRIHHHFFGAPAGQICDIARCNALLSNKSELLRIRAMVEEVESNGNHRSLTRSTIQNSNLPKLTQKSPIVDSFDALERHQIDVLVGRALCANGIPFNVHRNPKMINMFKAVARGPSDYKPPSFDRARTTLLDEVHREVDKELTPVKDTWITHGTSIVSDEWSNIKNQPLINVIALNSRGSTFLYADDFSGVEKSGKNIADYLLKSVDDIGPKNVLQIVTDNASNCRAAGKQIEKVHKHIFWSPCMVHTVNLIFKDFNSSFQWMSDTHLRGKEIVNYFKNHQNAQHIFRTNSDLELLKVVKTRFGSHYLLLERLSKCRDALAITVVQRGWKDWVKMGDVVVGKRVAATIIDDEFWDVVDNIIKITKPLYMMIKFADGEEPKMGEVYKKMDCMI